MEFTRFEKIELLITVVVSLQSRNRLADLNLNRVQFRANKWVSYHD
jgi:hypothetical protein